MKSLLCCSSRTKGSHKKPVNLKLDKADGDERLVPHRAELYVTVDDFCADDSLFSGLDDYLPVTSMLSPSPSWVHKRYDSEVGVLVSDLSGFTSTTRKYGIIHFASIIMRKRQLCLPILNHHGVSHVTFEADNVIAVFFDPVAAARAALEMKLAIEGHNASLDESRAHFKIKLNGIGLHCGHGLLIDKADTFYGETFRRAYAIGEDVCENGSVLVSHDLKDRLQEDEFFQAVEFSKWEGDSPETCFSFADVPGLRSDLVVPCDDASCLQNDLLVQLTQRHAVGADLQAIDAKLTTSAMGEKAVLMFSLDLSPDTEGQSAAGDAAADAGNTDTSNGADKTAASPGAGDAAATTAGSGGVASGDSGGAGAPSIGVADGGVAEGATASEAKPAKWSLDDLMAKKFRDLDLLEPALKARNGTKVEDMLWIFEKASDAVLGAAEARCAIDRHNATPAESRGSRCRVDGWGVHVGNVLFIEGTDVHWGDPVNTASKLGQDCASDGQLLVSPQAKDRLGKDTACAALQYKDELFMKSKVELKCFSIIRSEDSPSLASL